MLNRSNSLLISVLTITSLLLTEGAGLCENNEIFAFPKEYYVPLHVYVSPILRKPAASIEKFEAKSALSSLSKIKPSTDYIRAEFHYIKALCLQSDGNYSESAVNFALVEKYSSDLVLIRNAKVGGQRSKKQLGLIKDQVWFFRPPTKYPAILEEQYR